jgi:branched-chain amino acid transport system ATP-binding protein
LAAPELAVRDIHTYYGDSYVLHGLSLEVGAGEIVAILGRNGMGKTTLIRSVAGLTPPRRGDVFFRGVSIVGKTPYAISQAGIAIVPQGRRIFRSLSVRENLMLPTSALAPRAHTLDPGRKHWNSPSSPNGSTMPAARSPVASSRCWRSGAP